MPDVVVIGGGIIGAACAYERASRGAGVALLERHELAAGASGRNNGLWVTPTDEALLPMARRSLTRYLEVAGEASVPFHLDPAPIGLLAVALDEEELRLGEDAHEPYRAAGVRDDVPAADPARDGEPAEHPQRLATAGWEEATGRWGPGAIRAGGLDEARAAISTLLHPTADGGLIAGSSRQPVITPEAEDATVPARIVEGAIRLVPQLADAEVRSAWWGIRPMTPDERPLIGRRAPGLVVATGHGSEGLILGAGTGELVASLLLGGDPPFDPAPFDPLRPTMSAG